MGAAVSLREDFNGARLRVLAKAEKEGSVTRRLLAVARAARSPRRCRKSTI